MGKAAGAGRSGGWGLALAAAFAALLVAEQWRVTPQVDDAYIAYRYAANAVAGHGPVFNPGEWVEGFTSPLFTALVALGIALGFAAPVVGHALGLMGGAASVLATWAYVRALAPASPAWAAGLAPAVLLASAPFVRWTTSGLETAVFAAGLTASLAAAAAGRVGWLTAALVATAATRPEGGLAALILLGALALSPGQRPRALRAAAVFAACGAAGLALRLGLYGDWVPNTFHAKVGGVPWSFGLAYLGGFLSDGAGWLLPPAAFAAVAVPAARPGAALVVAFAAYVVAVGGDALGASRFLVPLLPALAALAGVGAFAAWQRGRAAGAAATGCAVLAVGWLALGPGPPGEGTKRSRILDQARRQDRFFEASGRQRAEALAERGATEAVVATGAIGSFGYHAGPGVRVIDILGLTDPHVARAPVAEAGGADWPGHMRSDADYVMEQEPDYVLIPRRGASGAGRLRAVADLWAHPALARDYVWDETLRGYRRRGS